MIDSRIQGLVLRSTGSHYMVLTDDGVERSCLVKGNLRLRGIRSTNPIAVGDRVTLLPDTSQTGTHYIADILPRRNYIVRRSTNLSKLSHILAANIDVSYLVCTIALPDTSTTFIDRFLATAEAYSIKTELIFNKVDIYPPEALAYLDELVSLYEGIGYTCHKVSALTGEGVMELREQLGGKIILMSGHSGVGKSSLINALIPGVELRTGDISSSHLSGMHTTTFSQMLPLPAEEGGYLIDTPGIKGFGTLEMNVGDASHYFPEMFTLSKSCRFGNCSHTHEPGCAVKQGLEQGIIASSRYVSYLSILEDEDGDRYRPEY